ncbi:hypothetical protein AAVH_07083 [Aphelenchoides avenae]|nr:hypothetical protein AAVH_07083 [Aphelenchus avenae]
MVRIIDDNKSSLKCLRGVRQSIFVHLPPGLSLDEFSVRGVDPNVVGVPAVDAKVFEYEIDGYRRLPLGYLRNLNADEVHVHFHRTSRRWSMQPYDALEKEPTISYALTPANHRTKKVCLILKVWDEPVSDVDFPRIFSEVAVCCPNLQSCEVEYDPSLGCSTYQKFISAVDELVPVFGRTLQEADMPYKVNFIIHLGYGQCDLRVSYQVRN